MRLAQIRRGGTTGAATTALYQPPEWRHLDCPSMGTRMGILSWWRRRRDPPGPPPTVISAPPPVPTRSPPPAWGRSAHSSPPTASRPAANQYARPPQVVPAPSRSQRIWCDLCDLDRRFCVHGLQDRRATDHVFATRLGSTYHLRRDCNALTVPRAMSLDAGSGNSRMLSMTRGSARQQGLDPCRICAGGTASGRRH